MSIPIEAGSCEYIVVRGVKGLDPVTAVFRDAGPGRGELIVACYGKSWSAYWGAMGDETVKEFVRTCNRGYICNKLTDYSKRQTKSDLEYLERIVDAVKGAIQDQSSPRAAAE